MCAILSGEGASALPSFFVVPDAGHDRVPEGNYRAICEGLRGYTVWGWLLLYAVRYKRMMRLYNVLPVYNDVTEDLDCVLSERGLDVV